MKKQLSIFTAVLLLTATSVFAKVQGKVDVGPVWLNVDMLHHNKPVNELDMKGARADGFLVVYSGFFLKPFVMAATGNGDLFSGGMSAGFYFPVGKWGILPQAGWSYTHLDTGVDILLDHPNLPQPMLLNADQTFEAHTPSLGLDVTFHPVEQWLFAVGVQYGWSQGCTVTKTPLGEAKYEAESRGFNYTAQMDYYFRKNWSANLGFAYNTSKSRERHGMKGHGIRLGFGHTF